MFEHEHFAISGCSHDLSRWDSYIYPSFTWNTNPSITCGFPSNPKIKFTLGCKRCSSPIWRYSELFKGRRCWKWWVLWYWSPYVFHYISTEDLTSCINAADIISRANINLFASNWLLYPKLGSHIGEISILEEINIIGCVGNPDIPLNTHGYTLSCQLTGIGTHGYREKCCFAMIDTPILYSSGSI